ncbi:hypothetical protein AXE80_04830 [Wenyingzhuangia fucanilytica]|uniref:Secretion system C-terminal sorting domain-containing protein n=1 Tax=Wenyingzhuangia fucanilytica TaxID=1790137 RepID=A0A1B1Y4H1_9FLAO|nr:T9SS type A sorting domain-containing protein [Wenyingzhuangia fucanilytica]ANW95643.1 hypothetical protein AXE80_04830 [Wenyingzhuangia fucanilytica]
MKKITLLAILSAISFTTYAQKIYDFAAGANPGAWVQAGSGISVTTSADGLVFEYGAGTPRIDITRGADPFVVSDGTHMLVTLINNSTEIGSFSGFFDKNNGVDTGTQFLGFQTGVTPAAVKGAGVEKTYIFQLSSGNYNNDSGALTFNDTDNISNMEYCGIRFRNASGAALTGTSADDGNLILKKVQIVNAGTILKESYDFSIDNSASFTGVDGTVSGGTSTIDFVAEGDSTTPKFGQSFYGVDASSNTYVHLVVDSNESNADQIKFQFVDASSTTKTYGNKTLNIGASTVVDINLSGKTEWTGNISDWNFVLSNVAETNVTSGVVKISKIVFDSNPTLSSKNIDNTLFSFSPNPAKNFINITGVNKINSVAIYDMTGRLSLETSNLGNNSVDISGLNNGLYLVKIKDVNNNISVKKLIVSK